MSRTAAAAAVVLALACTSDKKGPAGPFDGVAVAQRLTGIAGLDGEVSVLYDGLGVPHVYATSDGDAAYALGYAQAQDRLFEMDLFRKAARGRLGELLGPAADRNQDVFLRTMFTSRQAASNGSHHVEDLIAEQLTAELRTVCQRYADGVNRWLEDAKAGAHGAKLPPQYSVFSFTAADVAPWTVEDSMAVGQLQKFQLSDTSGDELLAARIVGAGLDPAIVADLMRHAQAVPSVVLPPAGGASLRSSLRSSPPAAQATTAALAKARGSIEGAFAVRSALHLPFADGDPAGSNNWSVAPSRSASGHVLVANDPHLSLQNPSLFYMVHLVTPTRNVAGVSFPGLPVVLTGHNENIAWGVTVVGYDVTDLYLETLDSGAAPTRVTYNGAQVPLVAIQETRKIRNVDDAPYTILLVPHRGPILPGSIDAGAKTAMSVRWTGQDPTHEERAFYDLNSARTIDDAFQAVTHYGVGAQNFNFGDTAGHIGYSPHALVPIRGGPGSACVPWLPMAGDTDACDWTGFIADADLPQARDPARGFIATANNDVTGALLVSPGQPDANPLAAPHYLYAHTDIGFREQRIQSVLQASSAHTLDAMTALQADNRSDLAATMVPGLLRLLQGQTLSSAAQAVVGMWQGWDFTTPRGDEAGASVATSAAASTAFHAFLRRFADRTLRPKLAGSAIRPEDVPDQQTLRILVGLTQTPSPLVATPAAWCSGPCEAAAAAALEDTVTFLAGKFPGAQPGSWRWGDLHHVLFASPVRPLLPDFGPLPNDGGLYTVDVANFSLWADNFEQRSGPSVRIATELDPAGVRSRMVIPGGQVDRPAVAGAAADPHYEDQVPAWLANQPGDQPFTQDEVVRAARSRVVFAR